MTELKDLAGTFEEYLVAHKDKAIDFRIRVDFVSQKKPTFYIHPLDVDGETFDYKVDGNFLERINKEKLEELP